jgi:DNA-directed RNA polymerase subunit beta'
MMLTKAKLDKNNEPEPYPGGLFDPQLTGGHGGRRWSHIKLAEPVPNPVYEAAIRGVLGLTTRQYEGLVAGEQAVTKKGEFVALGTAGSLTGGHAIEHLLDQVNVEKELEETKSKLSATAKSKGVDAPTIDKMVKKVKYLQTLDRLNIKPSEAYVLHNLPIIPPVMRPVSMLPGGKIRWADLNGLYSQFAQVNNELGDPEIRKSLPDQRLKALRSDMYDGVKAIVGVGTAGSTPGKQRGFLEQIHGNPSKNGYFQRTLLNRRQDLSMRSVIVPEPALGLDEVGIPEKKASTLYRPFVVRKLVDIGSAANPLEAQEMIKKETKAAKRALELVMQERPVILKRDPALHKHSALAFTPKLVQGRAIQIHPLVTSGFNADFDGDTMSAYVPVSRDAVDEARKMFPSNNLFNEATGKIMYQPTLESALGLYKLSLVKDGKPRHFSAPVDALKAVQAKTLDVNHPITIGSTKTTAGRLLLADALPEAMRDGVIKGTDPVDKKGLDKIFTTLAKNHAQDFGTAANRLKDLGNGMAFGAIELKHPKMQGSMAIIAQENPSRHMQFLPVGTHTLALDDFKADKAVRDPVFEHARKETDALDNLSISGKERERRTVDIWRRAGLEVEKAHREKIQKDPSNLALMQMAGVKPSWDQYKQMVLAPVLVTDSTGAVVPKPITRSYSEGLSVGDYWTQMSGARRGTVMKVQEVRDPGALSKQLVASSMNLVVTGHDCGTHQGIALPAMSNDVHDRILAHEFSAKGLTIPAGTVLAPDVVSKIRAADKNASLIVRSPLKCEHGAGLCQKCAGLAPTGKLYDVGTNTGLLAAQSLGERSVQVTLKAFHSGGVVSSGGQQVTDDFTRILQLTELPLHIPNSAVLVQSTGTVKKVEKDPTGVRITVGDHTYHVGKDRYGRGLHEDLPRASEFPGYKPWTPPKVGERFEAGQQLTDPNRTLINPHELYKATKSMDRVQNFLTDELHSIYGREGVRRQHIETVVKALGNLTKVRDPGDAEDILPGELQPYSKVRAINAELTKAGKKPIEHVPVLKGVDMLPLEVQEDWMAKLHYNRLRETLQSAASTGAVSHLHGLHPIPGIAYGAEFGLTAAHAKRPGLEHLHNVPAYAY